ncbi:hypothetical protein G6F56_011685 [Rhizopus delemar]|uniref:Uncharacterized protein n=1 Tax=Rhizopus stolonifer TaxID=4846 RepID=A0A367IK91_RHIST|nr:hypothetical protein G6F56_011685 [Rhizopus delemar]RCH78102.1 hypothetical protein CU098_005313 [Rhizopus stolonifer]
MDPVKIKSMFDRKRPIHCSLLRKNSQDQHEFVITVQKGMTEGKRIELNVENDLCKVKADLVRLPTPPKYVHPHLKVDSVTSLAPSPFTYTLQITELSLPLSTIA